MLNPVLYVEEEEPEFEMYTLAKQKYHYDPDAYVDPDRLASDLNQIFTHPQAFLYRDMYFVPHNIEKCSPTEPTAVYFNKMHGLLKNGEVAYYNAKTNGHARKICRNFNARDVRKMPTLRKICLNFVHSRMALIYEETSFRSVAAYHYQPLLINKLNIPEVLKRDLLELFDKCPHHKNYVGYHHELFNPIKWYFRKGSLAYTYFINHQAMINMVDVHKLYTWGEIVNIVFTFLPPEIAIEIVENHSSQLGKVQDFMY